FRRSLPVPPGPYFPCQTPVRGGLIERGRSLSQVSTERPVSLQQKQPDSGHRLRTSSENPRPRPTREPEPTPRFGAAPAPASTRRRTPPLVLRPGPFRPFATFRVEGGRYEMRLFLSRQRERSLGPFPSPRRGTARANSPVPG